MNQSLGQLPDAPLIYVLAQIRFSRVPNMHKLWEDFHQLIFDDYPEAEVEHIRQLTIKKEGLEPSEETETRWNLLSRDRRKGIILNPGMLILHTTSYVTSDEFFKDLHATLSKLMEVIPPSVQTSRLGLRYIDMLLPKNEIDVSQQISNTLGIFNMDDIGCSPVRSESIVHYDTNIGGVLTLRTRQTTGKDVLPNDLFPNNLEPALLLSTDKKENSIVGLLDFDHYVKKETPLDADSVIDIFRELHKTNSAAFRSVTTKAAMSLWNKES